MADVEDDAVKCADETNLHRLKLCVRLGGKGASTRNFVPPGSLTWAELVDWCVHEACRNEACFEARMTPWLAAFPTSATDSRESPLLKDVASGLTLTSGFENTTSVRKRL